MSKQVELEKLDRSIKDGEIRLRTAKTNIEALDKEIDSLSSLEIQLEENVKCLKKNNVVAIATEFKKAKEDLAKTKARLIALKNDRELFKKSAKDIETFTNKAKEDIEKLQKTGDNNVLRGKFSRKDNG